MTTSTQSASSGRASRRPGPVGEAADQCIRRLQSGYRNDHPPAVSTLARLRRGAGRPAHALPDLWGLTGMEELAGLLEDLPEKERQGIDLDRAEEALHLALTLWALHQQSHRDTDLHVRGHGLGAGVRHLMRLKTGSAEGSPAAGKAASRAEDEIDEPLRRRFVRVSTANSLESLAQRLREIVLLLRRETVPLDYGLLADQLYRWQWPNGRAGVHRSWGRDFHLAGYRRRENTEAAPGAEPDDRSGPHGPATPYSDYGPHGPGD